MSALVSALVTALVSALVSALVLALVPALALALVQARVAQGRSYTAVLVTLPLAAEQRLNDLMEEA